VAEKNGWPFPLVSYVQGDAISRDVVLLEAVVDPRIFRFSHLTLHQACDHGSASDEQSFWSLADNVEVPVRYRLTVNSTDAACEAAKAGLGIISVFSHHVALAFQNGTEVPVLPAYRRFLFGGPTFVAASNVQTGN
jgi:DNA-binding transcriptional LysR family regulator